MAGDACWWRACAQAAGPSGLCVPHRARDLRLRRTYGIGLLEVDRILIEQDDQCPVCGQPFVGDVWVIDHSHKFRRVRGVLHPFCNHKRVGNHEDWYIVYKVAMYLKNPPAFKVVGEDPTVPKKKRRRKPPVPKN